MKKLISLCVTAAVILGGCAENTGTAVSETAENTIAVTETAADIVISETRSSESSLEIGTTIQRGFINDNVLHDEDLGDIHFGSFIPESYDGKEEYALFITLPGWEGLYFQGLGENLRCENFGITAQDYNEKMIILAPQLDDWGKTSAEMTIALTEYFLENYNIDSEKVYLEGYSGGGETGSIVMGIRPELYTAYLLVNSKWDGDMSVLVSAKTPVYMVTGENDSYYGSEVLVNAYNEIYDLYAESGMPEDEISKILILDLKEQSYYSDRGISDQHAGGGLIADDSEIMGWLFGEH